MRFSRHLIKKFGVDSPHGGKGWTDLSRFFVALGFVFHTWTAATIILSMGVGGGIVGVLALTWLQQETAIAMQGRMMSLVMFAAVALDPFSQAISGVLLDISLTGLFLAATKDK